MRAKIEKFDFRASNGLFWGQKICKSTQLDELRRSRKVSTTGDSISKSGDHLKLVSFFWYFRKFTKMCKTCMWGLQDSESAFWCQVMAPFTISQNVIFEIPIKFRPAYNASQGDAFLANLGHFGQFGPFWPIWANLGHFGHFWSFWPFWPFWHSCSLFRF